MRTLILFAIASLVLGGFMTDRVARWCAAEQDRPGQTIHEPGMETSLNEGGAQIGLNMEFSMEAGLPMRAHRYVAAVDVDLANPNEPQQAGLTGPEIIPVGFAVNTVVFGVLLFVACLGIMRLTGGKRGG